LYSFIITSVAGIIHEGFINLSNFIPSVVGKVTTLCLHEVINHAPIGVGFHNELLETFQSRVKQVLLSLSHFDLHVAILQGQVGDPWVRGDGPSIEHQVRNGGHAIHPFPFRDLLGRGDLPTAVVLLLQCDSVVLVFHVGTDVIDLDDPTREGGPGPTDVEGGFGIADFFHAPKIA